MDEVAVKRALIFDRIKDVPALDGLEVLLVSAGDRRDQLSARAEIRASCEQLFKEPDFDPDSPAGQILIAVLGYLDGEQGAGL